MSNIYFFVGGKDIFLLETCHLSNDHEKFTVALCNLFVKGKSCGSFIQPIVILAFMH